MIGGASSVSEELPPSAAADLRKARALAAQGQLSDAALLCDDLLRRHPDQADALLLLGVVELQGGRLPAAAASIRASLKRNAANPAAHALLGDALLELQETQQALRCYEAALELNPDLVALHYGCATALLLLGRLREAIASLDTFLGMNPQHPEAWFHRGNACRELGRAQEALAGYEEALRLQPDFAAAWAGRGDALLDLDRPTEALTAHELAIRFAPKSADAHNSRGNSLRRLRRFEESLGAYDAALRFDPRHGIAHFNRGALLMEREERLDEALESLDQALDVDPRNAAVLRMRGDLLLALNRPQLAADSFAELFRLEPDFDYAAGALLHAKQSGADWSDMPAGSRRGHVLEAVLAGRRADLPFSFLAVCDSAPAQLLCARTYAADHGRAPVGGAAALGKGERHARRRIRLAYLSADFRAHAVSYLLAGIFERHDRKRFETIAVSLRPEESSPMGRRVGAAFARFLDVSAMTDPAAAELLRSWDIDIIVDLTGFTEGCRPRLLAYRPAPIQVSYLGYPGTMGAGWMDYILADTFVIPPELRSHYDERVVYLPGCFQANDDQRIIGAQSPTRADAGLPGYFVFCCFNNTFKIHAALFDVWMRVLDRVPGSVLWLLGPTDLARENLRREARSRGVDDRRLVFAGRRPYAEHLARLKLADLFLDTAPFNGGATLSDALWAGVPVLSCAGEAFAARMGGSLLRAVGLPELVAASWTEYEAKAVDLALRPATLERLRTRLTGEGRSSTLFDTDRMRRHLESAYAEMWRRHESGEPPASFAVAS
jgi:protein O-GlcNAc transferase